MLTSKGNNNETQPAKALKEEEMGSLTHLCRMNYSTFTLRTVHFQYKGCLVRFYYYIVLYKKTVFNAKSVDHDQTPLSAASDLGLTFCQCPFYDKTAVSITDVRKWIATEEPSWAGQQRTIGEMGDGRKLKQVLLAKNLVLNSDAALQINIMCKVRLGDPLRSQ